MKRLLFFLIACAVSAVSSAQLVQVTHELVEPFAGAPGQIGDYYHVYADLQDPTDFLSAVYAAGNDNLILGGADGLVINSVNGATVGSGIAIAFCGFVPDLCYDSHVTIGYRNDSQYYDFSPIICGAPITAIASLPAPTVIDDSFGNVAAAPNLLMDDGSWFTPNLVGCNDNGFGIGPLNRVLIAVLNTTPGVEPMYELNIQVFNEADGGDILYYVGDQSTVDGVDIDGSCLGLQYPFPANCVIGCDDPAACNYDPATTNPDPLLCCYDNCVTITVGGSSFDSEISWNILDDLNNVVASGFAPDVQDLCLADGCYQVEMFDSFGDGWDSGTFSLDWTDGSGNIATGTLTNFGPTFGSGPEYVSFGVPDQCGCTDSNACNYDPAAVLDDGSCILPAANDLCAGAIAVGPGTTSVDNTAACQNEIFGLCGTDCNSTDGWCAFECDEQSGVWYTFVANGCEEVTIETSDDGLGSGFTDTQLAVFDGCGGNLIAGNDDSGAGFFSLITFGCNDLVAGNTYWILVDGFGGDTGTCNMDITFDGLACQDGCTNPIACNYNACATVDDGSCIVCDPAACFSIDMTDSFGDGWDDGTYDIVDLNLGSTVVSGTLPGGSAGTDIFCLPDGCYSITVGGSIFDSEIGWTLNGADQGSLSGGAPDTQFFSVNSNDCFGCTDPAACNYDATAAFDDGTCAFDNDETACPDLVSMIEGGLCGGEDHSLVGSTPSPEADWQFGTAGDRWHQFVATHVGVRISVLTSDFDAQIILADDSFNELDEDDVNFVVGDEILNYTGLTVGNTYYVAVGMWAAANPADYTICIESLPESQCDYPGQTASQCDLFKADWVGPYGVDYIFHFLDQNTLIQYDYATGAAWDYVQLYDVPDLPWGTTFDVWVDVVHEVTDGIGNLETILINGTIVCELTVIDAPTSAVKAALNCANYGPHWLGDYLQSTPWVCGASDWEWEFTRTDVPELPIYAMSGSFFNLIQLGSVPGIVEGATYDVRVRAHFPNGSMANFGAVECVSTIGVAPAPPVGPIAGADEDVTEKDVEEDIAPLAAIYPNPNAGDFMNINLTNVETSIVTIDIYNQVGALVQSEQISVNSGTVNTIIELNDLSSGVYNVNIAMGTTVQTERLVIAK